MKEKVRELGRDSNTEKSLEEYMKHLRSREKFSQMGSSRSHQEVGDLDCAEAPTCMDVYFSRKLPFSGKKRNNQTVGLMRNRVLSAECVRK